MVDVNDEPDDYPFDALAARLCETGIGHRYSVKPEKMGTDQCPYAWSHQVQSRSLRKRGVVVQCSPEK